MAFRTYRVALRSTKSGQEFINTFHIGGDDATFDWSPATAQGLADKLGTATGFVPAYRNVLGTGYTFQDIVVREMLASADHSVPDQGAHTVGLAGTMAESSPVPPLEVCLILAIKTNAAIRSGHGYMALPSPPRANVFNQSNWNTGDVYWTNVGALMAELGHWNKGGSSWTSGNWGVGIYSQVRRDRGEALYFFSAVSYQARPEVRWRRSRS